MTQSIHLNRRQAGLLALLAPLSGAAAPSSAPTIDQLVAKRGFSGALMVRREGRTLHRAAYGQSNRPFAVAASPEHRYRIASITKLFTAVLILRLRDAGQLDLAAPVSRYLPKYAGNGAEAVPIRNLLNHTSGLPNTNTVESYEQAVREGMPIFQQPRSSQALVETFASGPLVRPTGTAFDYNNGDYFVLGKVIEALSGKPFEAALADLLTALGLKATGLAAHDRIIPALADSYFQPEPGGALVGELPFYIENLYAAGAMYSTVDDLAALAEVLYGGRLLSSGSLALMLTPGLDDYGFGQWIRTLKIGGQTMRTAERYGSLMGVNTLLFQVLEAKLTVVALGNTNTAPVGDLAADVALSVLKAT